MTIPLHRHPVVPFLSLAEVVAPIRDQLTAACRDVIESGWFLNGPNLEWLEAEFFRRNGRPAIAVGSGTHALQVLLLAHGIGTGDEVITTAASFYATAKAISLVGAVPVFADISADTCNIEPDSVRSRITARTRAILAVHLYGRPADIPALRVLAGEFDLLLLEDAAQAFGSSISGVPVGSLADGAAFSFYPTKNLGALGDAGLVVLPDEETATRARAARFLGWSGRIRDEFIHDGISGRMDEIQAAMLRVRLRFADTEMARRQYLASRYRAALPNIALSVAPSDVVDSSHLFTVRVADRDRVVQQMLASGIETQIHYRFPLHEQLDYRTESRLPEAERWSKEILSLPLNSVLSEEQQDLVIDAIWDAI